MFIILSFCKILSRILNFLGYGATTLPGKIALYFKYNILTKLSKNMHIICVTGTNGKTTTCALIEQGMKSTKLSYFINKSGANMISGVTTAFINNSTIFGKPKCRYAILECDENSLPLISRYLDAEIVVVTNIFRDQLDRYGEVSVTLSKIKEGLKNFDDAVFVLNADCPLSYSISKDFNNKCVTFGVDYSSNYNFPNDSPYCPRCGTLLKYSSVVYSQLGDFYCVGCGYKRACPDILASNISKNFFCVNGTKIQMQLGGIYNIYNYLSAYSVLQIIGADTKELNTYEGAFGRCERFNYNGNNILLLLVKNPVGYANCISYVLGLKGRYNIFFALNDNEADGCDVSWVWDVDFKPLKERICEAYTLGTRSYDMAVRLKYDVISANSIKGENYQRLVELIKSFNRDVIIFSTYTSMMSMRHFLVDEFGGDEFWQ